jgi:hypothetical protein
MEQFYPMKLQNNFSLKTLDVKNEFSFPKGRRGRAVQNPKDFLRPGSPANMKMLNRKSKKKPANRKRKTNRRRYGGNGDHINVGFVKSPLTENTLSIIDIIKGPNSIFGLLNYNISNVEEMIGFIKSGAKDKDGKPLKIDEKKFVLKTNETAATTSDTKTPRESPF